MAWEHQKSETTIFFDIVRYILILSGTGYILSLIWEHSSVFGLLAVIPVYLIMLNLFGFLTLPLYSFTPENRAKSKMLKAMQNGDFESLKKLSDNFERDFKVNIPKESETIHDIAKAERSDKSCLNETIISITKAAEQGDAAAQYNLGAMYFRGQGITQDYKESAKWFTKAAEQGYTGAAKMRDILIGINNLPSNETK
jgi:hypothetical protein